MNRISPLDVHSHHHHSKHDHPPQQGRSLYTPSPLFTLAPLYFVYDHLFTIAGKGCVMTGTVLAGTLHVGDDVEFLPHQYRPPHDSRGDHAVHRSHRAGEAERERLRSGCLLRRGEFLRFGQVLRVHARDEYPPFPLWVPSPHRSPPRPPTAVAAFFLPNS